MHDHDPGVVQLAVFEQVEREVRAQLGSSCGDDAEGNRSDVARVDVSFLHTVAEAMLDEDVDIQVEAAPLQPAIVSGRTCAADACAHVAVEEAFPSWEAFHRRTARLEQNFRNMSKG